VNYTAAGSCVIDANQADNANYAAAPQVTQTITVYQAPAFVMDSPPLTAVAGQVYDYTFEASGTPAPAYALASGAPSWLSVNASTGEVTGTPPAGTTSFSYAVTATNTAGTATAGPFTITVTKASSNADISAALSCPAGLTVGHTGTRTLTVANAGPATASKVVAAVLLPRRCRRCRAPRAAPGTPTCSPGA
jgi:Putative Ig domain